VSSASRQHAALRPASRCFNRRECIS
jgi:hypothetical protein